MKMTQRTRSGHGVLRVAGLVLCAITAFSQDLKTVQPEGYLSDFAGVVNDQAKARIEAYCGAVEQSTGTQIAIVTVKSLNDQPVEDVANALFRRWGIGKKGKDEGLLLLVAVDDHKDRIEVGYGLEPILPDGFAGSVLREVRPFLKQGDYNQAILTAAESMGSRIAQSKGVTIDSLQRRAPRSVAPDSGGIPWPLIIIGLVVLFSLFNRGGRGGGGNFITGMILGNLLGSSGRWGGGGGFGGSDSGGGGGFGGFGGGDSGGGGASDSW